MKGDFKSTIVVMYKNGSNVTTKCMDTPQALREHYESIMRRESSPVSSELGNLGIMRVLTGDEDDSVVYIDTNEVTFIAVQNYLTEEEAVKRIEQKRELSEVRNAGRTPAPSRIITPGPRRM